jgi:hypothetical protein
VGALAANATRLIRTLHGKEPVARSG